MKLELKHIAPYLPYGLKFKTHSSGMAQSMDSLDSVGIVSNYKEFSKCDKHICDIKPILRPLSSITKKEAYKLGILLIGEADMEDKEVGIGNMTLMGNTHPVIMYQDQEDEEYSVMVQFGSIGISVSGINLIPHEAYQWLLSHHFDIFNLIDNNLAIEK